MTGTIVKRKTAKGEMRYHVVWRDGKKQRWKTFRRMKAAEKFLTNAVKETQDGTYVHVRPTPMNDVFDRWLSHSLEVRLKQKLLKPSTAKSYRSMLETHLRPAFKDYRSDHFTAAAMSEWVVARATEIAEGDLSPKYYNNLVNLLSSILEWARRSSQRYLAHDPLADVELLPKSKVERDYLELAEIPRLLEAAETKEEDMILRLPIFGGLRRGELFSVKWSDLDEDACQLRIERSTYQGDITTPKTANSVRTIDLPPLVVKQLQKYREQFPPLEGNFIFRTDKGTPIDPDNWCKRVLPNIRTRAKLRDFGLHVLRHTCASLLIHQGESLKYVSKQMGHGSVVITADLYGHLFKETSASAMGRLNLRVPLVATQQKEEAVA